MSVEQIRAAFYLAWAEVQDAENLQPGNYLVHTNDVLEVLNTLEKKMEAMSR